MKTRIFIIIIIIVTISACTGYVVHPQSGVDVVVPIYFMHENLSWDLSGAYAYHGEDILESFKRSMTEADVSLEITSVAPLVMMSTSQKRFQPFEVSQYPATDVKFWFSIPDSSTLDVMLIPSQGFIMSRPNDPYILQPAKDAAFDWLDGVLGYDTFSRIE